MRKQLRVWMCSVSVLLTWVLFLASAAGQAVLVKRHSSSPSLSRGSVACGTSDPTDSSYYYCPLENSGSVRLLRQLTDFPCTYKQSWGYDRGGVWVQNGCRAEFAAGGGRLGDIFGPPAKDRDPREGVRDRDARSITCSSEKHQHTYCPVKIRNSVRLSRKLSSAPCKYKDSWGYDSGGIWVDDGCRAEFSIQ